MEIWAKVVKEAFRKVRTCTIYTAQKMKFSIKDFFRIKKSHTADSALKLVLKLIFYIKFPKNGTFLHFSIDYPVQCDPPGESSFGAKFLVMVFKGRIF